MALRSSHGQPGRIRGNVLEYEIGQEQAAALGRLGHALEAALTSLAAYDAAAGALDNSARPPRKPARKELLEAAGYALWCFIIQREACGLRDQATVVREYRIPADVATAWAYSPAARRASTANRPGGVAQQAFIHRYGGIF